VNVEKTAGQYVRGKKVNGGRVMEYNEMIRRVRRLDFIRNDQTANTAVKDVLGILAGSLNDEQARKLAGKFPEDVVLGSFGSVDKKTTISVNEYTAGICSQLKISVHQARMLLRNVLYFTKETSGANDFPEIKKSLPNDWADAIQNA
jgi:hypothetical protein